MAIEKSISERLRTELKEDFIEVVTLSEGNNVTVHIMGDRALIFGSVNDFACYTYLGQPKPRIEVLTTMLQKTYVSFQTFRGMGENLLIIE